MYACLLIFIAGFGQFDPYQDTSHTRQDSSAAQKKKHFGPSQNTFCLFQKGPKCPIGA